MDYDKIADNFPRLYHFSPAQNRAQIERLRAILSADLIRALSPGTYGQPERRLKRESIETPIGALLLNDQGALNYGHVKNPNSFSEREFVYLLNQFAFFWPGSSQRPIDMGMNFIGRYSNQRDRMLQVAILSNDFFRENHPCRIFLSTCNSGAPRSNPNALIYRGSDTFVPLLDYDGSVKEIKEIAVLGYARLPNFELSEVATSAELA